MSTHSGLRFDICEALDGREFTQTEIERMTAEEIFDEYCNWHGLIQWGPELRSVWASLQKRGEAE